MGLDEIVSKMVEPKDRERLLQGAKALYVVSRDAQLSAEQHEKLRAAYDGLTLELVHLWDHIDKPSGEVPCENTG